VEAFLLLLRSANEMGATYAQQVNSSESIISDESMIYFHFHTQYLITLLFFPPKDELKRERIAVLNSLAAHFAGLAAAENDATERDRLFAEATTQLNKADTVDGSHPLALVGKGAVMLARGDLSRAHQLFSVAANYSKGRSVPALLGQACVSFLRDQFHDALKGYRRALELNPAAPANVRLGMALSFHALNRPDAARAAFERVLQLDPANADALVGLAVLTLNTGVASTSSTAAPLDAHQTEEHVRSAMALVKRAYSSNPRSAAVLIQLANHFFYRKEYDKTLALAQKALQATQATRSRAEACFHIARAYHAQDDLDQAFQYYQQAIKLQADHPLALYGLGQAHMHRNEDDAALSCFEKVLKAFPDNWEVMFVVGSLLANKRDARDRARQLLQRCSELRPNDANVWLRYAQHLEALADYAASLQAYRKGAALLERGGERVPAEVHNNIAVLASMQGVHGEASTHALLALGALIAGNNSAEDATELATRARAYFDALVAQTRQAADAFVAEIDATVEAKRAAKRAEPAEPPAEGDDAAATPAATAATAANTAQRSLALLRANSDEQQQQQQRSAATPVVPPLNGSLVTALYNFARTSEAAGRSRDAADGYLALLATHRHYVDAWVRLGVMARDGGELDHADAWWECVHKTARNHAETRCLQGNLHLQRGSLLAAQKAFERVLQTVDKDDAYATLALGNIYYIAHFDKRDEARSLRQLEHAWQHYWGALQRDPRNACAANGVALVLAEKQYFSEAKDFFFQVREAVADNPSVWINLAHVQMRQGQFVAAVKTYTIASHKYYEDSDVQVLVWMARAYFEDSKFAQAKRVLQDALRLAPGDPLVRFNLALAQESHAVASLRVDTRSLQDARDALFELDTARREFETLAQRRGNAVTTIGAVGGVGAARTTALITKNAARHEKYCANTRHEVEKRVDEAEAAERLRQEQLVEQQERLQQQAAQRAQADADRLLAIERAKEEEQRQIEEDQQKLRELRDTWQSDDARKSKNAPKRKRKGRDDEDDDPLDGVGDDGAKAKRDPDDDVDDKPYNPGDSLAPAEGVPPTELPLEEDEASFHGDGDDDDDDAAAAGDGSGDELRARKKKLRSLSKKKRAVRKTTTAAAEHKAVAAAVVDADVDVRPRRRLKRRKDAGDDDEDEDGDNNNNNNNNNNATNETAADVANNDADGENELVTIDDPAAEQQQEQ
jgi:tetratricopeptide (TPR) repeat protein